MDLDYPINHHKFVFYFDYVYYSKVGLDAVAEPHASMSKVI